MLNPSFKMLISMTELLRFVFSEDQLKDWILFNISRLCDIFRILIIGHESKLNKLSQQDSQLNGISKLRVVMCSIQQDVNVLDFY